MFLTVDKIAKQSHRLDYHAASISQDTKYIGLKCTYYSLYKVVLNLNFIQSFVRPYSIPPPGSPPHAPSLPLALPRLVTEGAEIKVSSAGKI